MEPHSASSDVDIGGGTVGGDDIHGDLSGAFAFEGAFDGDDGGGGSDDDCAMVGVVCDCEECKKTIDLSDAIRDGGGGGGGGTRGSGPAAISAGGDGGGGGTHGSGPPDAPRPKPATPDVPIPNPKRGGQRKDTLKVSVDLKAADDAAKKKKR